MWKRWVRAAGGAQRGWEMTHVGRSSDAFVVNGRGFPFSATERLRWRADGSDHGATVLGEVPRLVSCKSVAIRPRARAAQGDTESRATCTGSTTPIGSSTFAPRTPSPVRNTPSRARRARSAIASPSPLRSSIHPAPPRSSGAATLSTRAETGQHATDERLRRGSAHGSSERGAIASRALAPGQHTVFGRGTTSAVRMRPSVPRRDPPRVLDPSSAPR